MRRTDGPGPKVSTRSSPTSCRCCRSTSSTRSTPRSRRSATPASNAEPAFTSEDTPHRELNDAAMANLAAWVPALPLYRLRAARGGYEAAPTWRPSSSGKSDDERALNLKIHPKGIRDFGADKGYTPLDLVMVALGCDLDRAFGFLADRLGWSNGATIELRVDTAQTEPEPSRRPILIR